MLRKRILCLALAPVILLAVIAGLAGAVPDATFIGWAAAFAVLALAARMFLAAASATRELHRYELRGHARARLRLLALVRELRDASASAAAASLPDDAPPLARADCERLSRSLLGFHLGRAAWDPLARDFSNLRLAIRAANAMQQMRPHQMRLVGSPFRFLQEQCDEMLQRHAPLPGPGSAARPLKSGTLA